MIRNAFLFLPMKKEIVFKVDHPTGSWAASRFCFWYCSYCNQS